MEPHIGPLFKVLVDGKSAHGGDATYPPIGEWTADRDPACCVRGWHLTSDPLRWWTPRASLYLAEGRGLIHGDGSDKAAFESVRLVAQITRDWPLLAMFPRLRAFLAATARSIDPKSDIGWANLSWANLSRANLSRANLSRANLSWANLSWADLIGANLSRADLIGANLSRADLSRANLSWADLIGANLSRANLSRADLIGANADTDIAGHIRDTNGQLQRRI